MSKLVTEIIEKKLAIDASNCNHKASQLLSNLTDLSQEKIKDAMQKGAVWLLRGKNKKRLRRASKKLQVGDVIELNYNPQILNAEVPIPELVHDAGDYSIWFKPYGLYCQGSRWGDFASINRWVEVNLASLSGGTERPVFLVHRLDRATSGLILLCHSKKAARLFSEMFREGRMDKRYQAVVLGDFSAFLAEHAVNEYKMTKQVDGKDACSIFSCVDSSQELSLVDVKLVTGRKHQIRQHLSSLGFPIVGDRLYGLNETDEDHERDLQLQSVSLQFICPLTHAEQHFQVEKQQRLQL